MNTEPVAWMSTESFEFSYVRSEKFSTPVYAHPAQELTDEQILCLWDWWSGEILSTDILDFADAYKRVMQGEEGLLEWHKEYVKKMNEQYPSGKVTEE